MITARSRAIVAGHPDEASGLDTVRMFNRYEFKYLADQRTVAAFRAGLGSRVDRDRHGARGFYQVWSRYYDTADLSFYWQKIDGIRFRRKLRVRHYGEPDLITGETPVWVEIKQRLNRVTQKRRVLLPYAEALRLCAGQDPGTLIGHDVRVAEEIVGFVSTLALRPITVVGYVREALLGRDEDGGLRITIDSRLRGRDRDLDLHAAAENRLLVNPEVSVIELKVNERVPYWLTEHIALHGLRLVRLSKYCQSIEAFHGVPRSTRVADDMN
ncbi:MAG TPA: polyphosphate polymerase domain-containing protein [Candidatus Limnocylindria bacterium]|nr:polyphosphate polymerase domain-containing protein [Candidatus Limnocylindria bacterium]